MSVFVPLLLILSVLDIITTRRALAAGAVEANPVIRWAMKHGKLWIVAKLLITVVSVYLLRDAPLWMAALCVVYAVVVWSNWRLAR